MLGQIKKLMDGGQKVVVTISDQRPHAETIKMLVAWDERKNK